MSRKLIIVGSSSSAPSYDVDAQLLFDAIDGAGGSTSVTEKEATSVRIIADKLEGTWNKRDAWYLMIGGTATSCKFNAKDPTTFELQFFGGWTFSSNGALPDGSSYATTGLIPSAVLSLNSTHLSYYSRSNVNLTEVDFGTRDGTKDLFLEINTAGASYFKINTSTSMTFGDPNSLGFYMASRIEANISSSFKNGSRIVGTAAGTTGLSTNEIYIGAFNNNGSPALYSTKECASASIGLGFLTAEAIQDNTDEQIFQTTLGRNV